MGNNTERREWVELTTLCLIYKEDVFLLQNRVKKDWPGYTLPGGHVEPGESIVDSVIREMKEETGLTVENVKLCGVKQFQTKEDARYVVFFYKADQYHGQLQSSDEGEVFWLRRSDFHQYTFVEDFGEMLKIFEQDDLNEFYYYKENGNWALKLL